MWIFWNDYFNLKYQKFELYYFIFTLLLFFLIMSFIRLQRFYIFSFAFYTLSCCWSIKSFLSKIITKNVLKSKLKRWKYYIMSKILINVRKFQCIISFAMLNFFLDHFLCFRNFDYLNFKAVFNKIFKFAIRSHKRFFKCLLHRWNKVFLFVIHYVNETSITKFFKQSSMKYYT